MIEPKISRPNSKTKIVSFNINNTVCKRIPGVKAQGCLKHCYYNKFKRLYPNQEPFLNNNLKASKLKGFVKHMIRLINKENIKYFRIHSCGEFYNQDYFNKWCKIIEEFPNIIFYTYTKNIDLNVSRPKNFTLYLSDDKGIWGDKLSKFDGISKIRFKGDPIPKGFTLCMKKNVKVCFNKH